METLVCGKPVTLPNPKNDREVFDYVKHFLLSQLRQCRDDSGQCAYRGSYDMACAAGCLIEDKDYKPTFEGCIVAGNIESLLPNRRLVTEYFIDKGYNTNLLYELQIIHDCNSPDKWADEFDRLEYKLF